MVIAHNKIVSLYNLETGRWQHFSPFVEDIDKIFKQMTDKGYY